MMDLSYILNELGEDRVGYFNAVAPPIFQTSNFVFDTVDSLRSAFAREYDHYLYSRGQNPTVDILRKKLAALDEAEDCMVFNSGIAAIFAAVMTNVQSGDHIISIQKPYSWAQRLFNQTLPAFGVSVTYVEGIEVSEFAEAIRPETKIIYLESPNSWSMALQDLEAVAALAKAHNIITICDNSYSTPVFQKPILLGIDIAIQSATKYIGGHSDTLGGVVCGNAEMIQKIFTLGQMTIGSGIQPFNAWLLLRGLRTLPVRLERSQATTFAVVDYLEQHPMVEQVIFPFDPGFEQYALAKKQMSGACGLVTFVTKAKSVARIEAFCNALQHIKMAVSWGGHESLIIPRCAAYSREKFFPGKKENRMLRMYVGLEDAAYLLNDLKQAFEKAAAFE